MLGLIIGLGCGALELFLLSRLTYALTHNGSAAQIGLLFFMKILLLAGVLALGVWLWRDQLVWTAVGITGILIVGAIVMFIRFGRKGGGGK